MIQEKYLYVYASIFPVKGYTRTMLVDTFRRALYFVDNSYHRLFDEFRKHKLNEIYNMLEEDFDRGEFEKFIEYLISNELAILVDEIETFPPMNMYWDDPSVINNAIIDVGEKLHNFKQIFEDLNSLGCKHIQIRAYHTLKLNDISSILEEYEQNDFRSIEIYSKYKEGFTTIEQFGILQKRYPYLSLIIHGATKDELIIHTPCPDIPSWELGRLLFVRQEIMSCSSCGIINQKTFYPPSLELFMENQIYNGCLNRKISIDIDGEIKNCPSMSNSFGNIENQSLSAVAERQDFQVLWNINKSQIKICSDCEYRAVCTDCRAYLQSPDDIFSKPLKCSYDPYKGAWDENVNPIKKEIVQ
ncbi:grasp-with-spasm system SPASM domain peptide maturase [uncultured Sphingobacterium sp.]|uniref:grasp-with-spasm system SPASM domain peptide maturase n=1 Tax=uncultured Sphingobacterium sp. TaxID=182688 RepID=UPI003748EF43